MGERCFLYARVSSKEQEREGFSIPAQLDLLRQYAERHGFQVAQEYTEAETAKQSGREQFNLMLKDLSKANAPKILLVEKTDRLYRNFKDYTRLEDLQNSHDLQIHLVKENEVLTKNATSHMKLIHGIKVLMAKNYIDNLSEEVKKGKRAKAMAGGWPLGPVPYGYRRVDGQLEPHDEKAFFVRAAFQLYATGLYSLEGCADQLLEMGYRYNSSQPRIYKSRLESILKNRAYIGQVAWEGQVHAGVHPALIDMDTWTKVVRAFRKGNKPVNYQKRFFVYRGLLECGECGAAMIGENKKGGKYILYRCLNRGKTCNQAYINETVLDAEAENQMKQISLPESYVDDLRSVLDELEDAKHATDDDEIEAMRVKVRRIKQRLRTAYDDRLAGNIDEALWLSVSRDYQEEIDQLEAKIQQIGQADLNYYKLFDQLVELPKRLSTCWSAALPEEKAQILNLISLNVSVKDGKASLALKEPFKTLSEKLICPAISGSRDVLRTFLVLHSRSISAAWQALAA